MCTQFSTKLKICRAHRCFVFGMFSVGSFPLIAENCVNWAYLDVIKCLAEVKSAVKLRKI